MAWRKSPKAELLLREDAQMRHTVPEGIRITLANRRPSQDLSFRQAAALAKKLLKLVQEQKIREVMES